MAEREVGIRIVLRHRDEWSGDGRSFEARREKFWSSVARAAERTEASLREVDRSPEALETRFLRTLPNDLRESFFEIFPSRKQHNPYDETTSIDQTGAPLLVFEVLSHSYSSLDLVVGIEPLDRLAQAFDNNFDYFRVALQGFVPLAVSRSLSSAIGGHWSHVHLWGGIDISVEPTTGLRDAFERQLGAKAAPTGWSTAAKANYWLTGRARRTPARH